MGVVLPSMRLVFNWNFLSGGEPLMLVVLPPVGLLAAVEVVDGDGVVQLLWALKRFSEKRIKYYYLM